MKLNAKYVIKCVKRLKGRSIINNSCKFVFYITALYTVYVLIYEYLILQSTMLIKIKLLL